MRERATSGHEAGGTNPMPIYEFQCHHCGGRIEELMRLSDPDPVDCPSCSKPGLKRMLSAPSFRLAGSGWYETDFKKDGKRNLAGDGDGGGKESGAGSNGDSGAAAKTEAKPESKPESAKPAATPAGESKKTGPAPPAAS